MRRRFHRSQICIASHGQTLMLGARMLVRTLSLQRDGIVRYWIDLSDCYRRIKSDLSPLIDIHDNSFLFTEGLWYIQSHRKRQNVEKPRTDCGTCFGAKGTASQQDTLRFHSVRVSPARVLSEKGAREDESRSSKKGFGGKRCGIRL